jgi:hypothetical protein
MIRIRFSDTDWLDSQGRVVKMSLEKELNANSRLTYAYTAPVITEDTWKGRTFPVQINQWESYTIQFAVKEVAIHALAKMQVCKNIEIEDTSTGEIITVDTLSSGAISIEPGNRYDSNQYFTITVKANKIKSYPGLAVLNTNVLRITINLIDYNFYTDFDIIDFVTDAEAAKYQDGVGIDVVTKTNSKNGKRMLFYFMEATAMDLKRKCENLGFSAMVINPLSNNFVTLETGKCKLTELTEGLYKCECEFIVSANQNFS